MLVTSLGEISSGKENSSRYSLVASFKLAIASLILAPLATVAWAHSIPTCVSIVHQVARPNWCFVFERTNFETSYSDLNAQSSIAITAPLPMPKERSLIIPAIFGLHLAPLGSMYLFCSLTTSQRIGKARFRSSLITLIASQTTLLQLG